MAKPWPAIAAKRDHAEKVQNLVQSITHDEEHSWENALLSLLETYHVNVTSLDTSIPIENYLDQAIGFQSAYSFPSCSPDRSIVFCTTSLIEHFKCSWLQEAASVYGIEPNIRCIRSETLERCMEDTKHSVAHVVMVDQDQRIRAQKDYHLQPLLYEYSKEIHERYIVVAVIRADSDIHDLSQLHGKRACFPEYRGASYMSVLETLQNKSLVSNTDESEIVDKFFGDGSCLWRPNKNNCDTKYKGEAGALRCLAEGYGDVAFVSSEIFKNLTAGELNEQWVRGIKKIKLLCPYGTVAKQESEPCYLHWIPRGHLMIHNLTQPMRKNEIYNSLRDMNALFGKQYKSHTIPFTMFGPFDRKSNIIFRDTTDGIKGLAELEKDKLPRLLERSLTRYANAPYSVTSLNGGASTITIVPNLVNLFLVFLFSIRIFTYY